MIMQHALNDDIRSYRLTPLTMAFRGHSRHMTPYMIEELRPTGVELPIRGRPCREYTLEPSPGHVLSFWLDTARDFNVVRLRNQENGKLREQLDVEYKEHPACGWVPQSWTRNAFAPSGEVRRSTRVDVMELHVNEPQEADLFEIRFPAGVMVGDQRDSKDYVIQPDGSMREISPSGELLPTTKDQPGTPWYQRHRWLLLSVAASAVLLLATILVWRIRQRRQLPA